jgi:hypothetical protein
MQSKQDAEVRREVRAAPKEVLSSERATDAIRPAAGLIHKTGAVPDFPADHADKREWGVQTIPAADFTGSNGGILADRVSNSDFWIENRINRDGLKMDHEGRSKSAPLRNPLTMIMPKFRVSGSAFRVAGFEGYICG